MTEETQLGPLLAAEYAIINQMLAEIDKEIRDRFGDIQLKPEGLARVTRLKQYCRGKLKLKDLPEEERENAREGRKIWMVGGGTEVDLLLLTRYVMFFEGIHRRHAGDAISEQFEQEVALRYIHDISEKYKALLRQADGEVVAEETPKMKRERLKAGAFMQMQNELKGTTLSESEAARRVWNRSMRDVFKNARSLCSQYNTWKNANARASRAQAARANK